MKRTFALLVPFLEFSLRWSVWFHSSSPLIFSLPFLRSIKALKGYTGSRHQQRFANSILRHFSCSSYARIPVAQPAVALPIRSTFMGFQDVHDVVISTMYSLALERQKHLTGIRSSLGQTSTQQSCTNERTAVRWDVGMRKGKIISLFMTKPDCAWRGKWTWIRNVLRMFCSPVARSEMFPIGEGLHE